VPIKVRVNEGAPGEEPARATEQPAYILSPRGGHFAHNDMSCA